ncbi:hypothetical protein V5O48_000517 [Marasmius crinis-equi]|uniref:Amidase domain-containing protein n=1 Tax=Marasmius crinis-equi TaxID=585013 RepID=A0ABR3G1D4_9AGAR
MCLSGQSFRVLESNPLGDIVEIDGQPYFVQNTEGSDGVGHLKDVLADYFLVTSVVATAQSQPVSARFLSKTVTAFGGIDDVWTESFLQGIAYTSPTENEPFLNMEGDAIDWLRARGTTHLFVPGSRQDPRLRDLTVIHYPKALRPGPHAYSTATGSFHNIYRLYPDVYESFMLGCIPQLDTNGFEWIPTNFTLPSDLGTSIGDLSLSSENPVHYQYIPVSSRLHHITFSGDGRALHPPSTSLAGKRMAVKDIFHMRGLPTSAGSKAFLEMTGSFQPKTAQSIEKLLSLGIVPIGKTRTSQFAHGASPWEFQDFGYSWNPRGDGMLTVAASSSGSGSAIAGYGWLDLAVGSDTRGSVRKPASLVGVYGVRPSSGSVSLEGVVPLSEEMDTAGIFARDPLLFETVVKELYKESPVSNGDRFSRLPARLLYPIDHFPAQSPDAQLVYDSFINVLTTGLNITKHPINLTHELSPLFPNQQFSAFQSLSNRLSEYHSWNQVGKPLTEWYYRQLGRAPALDPMPEIMFVKGKQYSENDYNEAVAYKRSFTDALRDVLFQPDADSCSDSVLVYDAGTGGRPSYRVEDFNALEGATDVTLVKPGKKATLQENLHYLASMGGLVDVTVPIGEVAYFSQVSRRWEPIPVTVQLVARRGCDAVVLELVKVLAEKGILKRVGTGLSVSSDL